MLKSTIIALAILCAPLVAEARPAHKQTALHPQCNISMPCELPYASSPQTVRETRGKYVSRQMGFGAPVARQSAREARPSHRAVRAALPPVSSYSAPEPSLTLAGTTPVDRVVTSVASQIVPHPFGCPARAFCACGAAVRVFGHPVRNLWLAANWLRFPRAMPAPGMVAARRGHVFVLESHIGGSIWLAWDANSGNGLTKLHARSIAGFAIVNPKA